MNWSEPRQKHKDKSQKPAHKKYRSKQQRLRKQPLNKLFFFDKHR